MMDLMPRVEAGLPNGFSVTAEISLGILLENNNDSRFALYFASRI
jgi:hypothetical protein